MHYYNVLLSRHSRDLLGGYYYCADSLIPRGSAVEVDFRNKMEIGIISEEIKNPNINLGKIKSITAIIGRKTVSDQILDLAKELSRFYCTSFGETLFELLPDCSRIAEFRPIAKSTVSQRSHELIIGHFQKRMLRYLEIISASKKPSLILLPSYRHLDIVKRYLIETLPIPAVAEISDRLSNKEYARALNALSDNKISAVLSTRGGVKLLGYNFHNVIIDDPLNFGFFNDRKPAYTARHIAEQYQNYFDFDLYLGSGNIDPESLWQLRHGQIRINNLSDRTKKSIAWCETKIESVIGNLTGNINLIVCPYSSSTDDNGSYLSVNNVASQIKGNIVIMEAGKHFKLPTVRPIYIVATKKVLDYQELIFDETAVLGVNQWLSMPGDDNIYMIMDMIWRLMGQTKDKTYLHSDRAIPVLEEMLGMRVPASLEKFMSSRHAFKLPPYFRKIDIYSKSPKKIEGVIDGVNTVIDKDKLSTYIDRENWPPANIDEIYLNSNKVLVDAP